MPKRVRRSKRLKPSQPTQLPSQQTGPSSQRCKVCRSPNRQEIDRRLVSGESTRSVSSWLASCGEAINQRAVVRHKSTHANVAVEAKRILAERSAPSQSVVDAVTRVIADLDMLDDVAAAAKTVVQGLVGAMQNDPTVAQATLFTGALKGVRDAVATRAEILNGKKVSVDAVVSGGLANLFAELGREEPSESSGQETS